MRIGALLTSLALSVWLDGTGILPVRLVKAADEFVARQCDAAVPYAGAPLHAPVAAEVFANVASPASRPLDAALVARLEAAVDWILANTSAPGLTVAVAIDGAGSWQASRGLAVADPPTKLAPHAIFYWASTGKLFTAATVMQLVDEGKLNYSDMLARWFPDFPNAKVITIDHLLTHTSGMFSFNADLPFRRQQSKYQPPDRLIAIAARHGCAYCPGERWSYTNTGYVLLGRIIESIEGRPLHEVFRARLIEPLGLTETVAFAPDKPPHDLPVGHVDKKPDRDFEPTTPFAAGNIGASAADMIRFWHAMLSGKVVRPTTIAGAYERLYPMFDFGLFYGRGVMLYEFTDKAGQKSVWLGHSGGTPGIKSVVAYDIEARAFVAVALNGNVSAEATANKLIGEVKAHRSAR